MVSHKSPGFCIKIVEILFVNRIIFTRLSYSEMH
jgi:hypothetical protein